MRKLLDWVITFAIAIGFVLVFEAEIAKPYRIPSASMEPTLHCAKPGLDCEGSFNDRVIANRLDYRFANPKRGQIVVFTAPKDACGIGGTFVKRLIGIPGDTIVERNGFVWVDGKKLHDSYVTPRLARPHVRDVARRQGPIFLHGRRPRELLRLANVGHRPPFESHRPSALHLLAAFTLVLTARA